MKNFLKTTFSLLVAVAFAVSLSACAGDTDTTMNDTTGTAMNRDTTMGGMQNDGMRNGGMMNDSISVQGTTDLLKKGVTSIAINKAVRNISGWEAKLDAMSDRSAPSANANDTFDDISDKLDDLSDELQSDNLDGEDIGEALQKLGRMTNNAAKSTSGSQMTQLQSLSQTLKSAGNQLTSGASGQDVM